MWKQNLPQQSIEWYSQHSWIPAIYGATDYPFWMSNVQWTSNVHYEIFAYFLKEFYERNMWKQNLPQQSIKWYTQHSWISVISGAILSIRGSLLFLALPVLNVQCPCMNAANDHYEIFAYFLKEFYERNMWKQNLPQHSIEWYSQHSWIIVISGADDYPFWMSNVQCPMNFECPLWNFRIFLERILRKKYVETKPPTAFYRMI